MDLCQQDPRCRGVGMGYHMPPSPVTMQCCFFAAVTLYVPGLPESAGGGEGGSSDLVGAQCAALDRADM